MKVRSRHRQIWHFVLGCCGVVWGLGICWNTASAEETLQQRLQDQHAVGADFWVYNDLAAARADVEAAMVRLRTPEYAPKLRQAEALARQLGARVDGKA